MGAVLGCYRRVLCGRGGMRLLYCARMAPKLLAKPFLGHRICKGLVWPAGTWHARHTNQCQRVFAGRADAPHSKAWRKRIADVVERPPFNPITHFALDQAALNAVIDRDHLPCDYAPVTNNFLCIHGRPKNNQRQRYYLILTRRIDHSVSYITQKGKSQAGYAANTERRITDARLYLCFKIGPACWRLYLAGPNRSRFSISASRV